MGAVTVRDWRAPRGMVPAVTQEETPAVAARRKDDSPNWGGPRPNSGRPQKYRDLAVVSVPLPQLVLDALDAMAEKQGEGVKKIDVIRQILAKHKDLKAAFAKAELK